VREARRASAAASRAMRSAAPAAGAWRTLARALSANHRRLDERSLSRPVEGPGEIGQHAFPAAGRGRDVQAREPRELGPAVTDVTSAAPRFTASITA